MLTSKAWEDFKEGWRESGREQRRLFPWLLAAVTACFVGHLITFGSLGTGSDRQCLGEGLIAGICFALGAAYGDKENPCKK